MIGHPWWNRAAVVALAVLALASGGPPAPARAASTPADPVSREIPETERTRLLAVLDSAESALPIPPHPYRAQADDSTREVDRRGFWDPASKRWTAPAQATLERVFDAGAADTSEASDDVPLPSLEYHVYLNHEPDLPRGLASVGATPRQFPMPGTVAVEVTVIGTDPRGGRVAVPISPEEAATAPAVVRIYLGSADMESAVRVLLGGGQLAGSVFPSVRHAAEVHSIVVDFYGPRRVVEGVAPALDVRALRRLLSESGGRDR